MIKYDMNYYRDRAFDAESCRMSAEEGYAPAQYNLACFLSDENGGKQNWIEAVKWFGEAVEAGNAASQRSFEYCYECGKGVEQDFVQAAFWYRKGAEGGDPDAQVNLENFYFGGKGVENDDTQAVYWYAKSAEHRSVLSIWSGIIKEEGRAKRYINKPSKIKAFRNLVTVRSAGHNRNLQRKLDMEQRIEEKEKQSELAHCFNTIMNYTL